MRVETERMYLYPLSDEEMRLVIEKESDPEMKQAYTEMLEGSLSNPDKRIWYAIWNMELKDDPETIVGDFCFKGFGDDGVIEIGYGLKEEYRHHGYMTEAVKAITEWALSQDGVKQVEAETDAENIDSQKVLFQSGFASNGKMGEEGPRFVYENMLFLMIMVIMVCSLTACGQQETGTDDAAYPWSDAPVETIEAIVEVVQLPDEPSMDDSSSSTEIFENKDNWPDVEELVNQRGDETTVYLLADGRYMDRINAVYIYDGKDTWTDESGVEWNKAVK